MAGGLPSKWEEDSNAGRLSPRRHRLLSRGKGDFVGTRVWRRVRDWCLGCGTAISSTVEFIVHHFHIFL